MQLSAHVQGFRCPELELQVVVSYLMWVLVFWTSRKQLNIFLAPFLVLYFNLLLLIPGRFQMVHI